MEETLKPQVQVPTINSTETTAWHRTVIKSLDHAIDVTKSALADPKAEDSASNLQSLLNLLSQVRGRALEGTLQPPCDGLSLGLARYVTDWVFELGGPLHNAICDIEEMYSAAPIIAATKKT